MRAVNYALKPLTINAAKPADKRYSISDGGGLVLEVLPSGAKTWRYKYRLEGKQQKVTIGSYPAVNIKAARDKHEEMRAMVERGESPALVKQASVQEAKAAAAALTFREFADRWVEETLFYRGAGYRAQIVRWLDGYVYPAIGVVALADVTPAQVLGILEAQKHIPTTADRLRVIVTQIFNFAIRKLLASTNPAAPLKGAIIVPPRTHHRHLSEPELGAFWRALDGQGAHPTTLIACKLLMLTMVRKMELLRATWAEFDIEGAAWSIPAARMKESKPHRVFLSTQALALLRKLHELTGDRGPTGYVLPTIFRRSSHMADATLNHLFRRLDFGVLGFSPHGTRGTAATLLREHGFGRDVVELLLAHAESNSTVAAYSHMELVPERKRAMQFLADRVDKLAAGADVVALRA